jgi:Eukaryotic aspartyl protease
MGMHWMGNNHIELRTTLAYAKGAYTVEIKIGSQEHIANVLLDTGSSTLAVLPLAYDASHDTSLMATTLAQSIAYGVGTWAGPVLKTKIAFGDKQHARVLPDTEIALIKSSAQNFRDADGLLGLAYRKLNKAHDVSALLQEKNISPTLTWPWPFDTSDSQNLSTFKTELHAQPLVNLTPCFSALEEEGIVSDRFSMLIKRALTHVLDDASTIEQLAADPLNEGVLVLGAGEECQHLYEGDFVAVKIVDDLYYNANLIAVQVGDRPQIPAPALDEKYQKNYASNAIFDTGSSFLVMEASVYDAMLSDFSSYDEHFPELIKQFREKFKTEHGIPNDAVKTQHWPKLHFYFESPSGHPIKLTCTPGRYWQRNALHAGECFFMLMRQLPKWPNQSIIGLPLMSEHYCVFDRRGNNDGILRIAKAKQSHG